MGKIPSKWDLPDPIIFDAPASRFTPRGAGTVKRLGTIETYDREAQELYDQGFYVVSDLVVGDLFKVKIGDVVPVIDEAKASTTIGSIPADLVVQYAWCTMWHDLAEAKDLTLQTFGVGALFDIGVADGSAHYVVTKVNKQTCWVEWRGFGMDRYTDRHFGWGGSFQRQLVESYCGVYPRTPRLFPHRSPPDVKTWRELEDAGIVPRGMAPASYSVKKEPSKDP